MHSIRPLPLIVLLLATTLVSAPRAGADRWSSQGPFGADGTAIPVGGLAIDPITPTTFYAATHIGTYKSTDGGIGWQRVELFGGDVVAIDPLTPSTLYVGSSFGFVLKSTDGGGTWTELEGIAGLVEDLVIDGSDPSTIYIVTFGGGSCYDCGVHKSTDGGATWTVISGFRFLTLAIDPLDTTTLYAGTLSSAWKSTDGGTSWSQILTVDGSVLDLAIDPVTPTRLFAGTSDDGLLRSTDGGATWSTVEGLNDLGVQTLIIDPERTTTVYAGTLSRGVYRSLDGGESWFPVPGRPERTPVLALALDLRTTSTLYAGTGLGMLGVDLLTRPAYQRGRFQVEIEWRDFNGNTGTGREVRLSSGGAAASDDSGVFFFFSEDNWELLAKVLDGCELNGHFWVFTAATTNVRYVLTVTDTATGEVKTYRNPLGTSARAVTDIAAFATCASE